MKTCTKCNITQEFKCFAFKNKVKQIRASWCKTCQKAYAKKDYLAKTAYYKAKGSISRNLAISQNKQYIKDYLNCHPCVDCGETDIQVLEFDHIEMLLGRGGRVANFLSYSSDRLKAEIAKCEVRCANCHTRRTRQQMGWFR